MFLYIAHTLFFWFNSTFASVYSIEVFERELIHPSQFHFVFLVL